MAGSWLYMNRPLSQRMKPYEFFNLKQVRHYWQNICIALTTRRNKCNIYHFIDMWKINWLKCYCLLRGFVLCDSSWIRGLQQMTVGISLSFPLFFNEFHKILLRTRFIAQWLYIVLYLLGLRTHPILRQRQMIHRIRDLSYSDKNRPNSVSKTTVSSMYHWSTSARNVSTLFPMEFSV